MTNRRKTAARISALCSPIRPVKTRTSTLPRVTAIAPIVCRARWTTMRTASDARAFPRTRGLNHGPHVGRQS
jgi:hypothetical protein